MSYIIGFGFFNIKLLDTFDLTYINYFQITCREFDIIGINSKNSLFYDIF